MDFYTALAAEALKKPYDAVTTEERERARKYWYVRLYSTDTTPLYINEFTFHTTADAYTFMSVITYKHTDGRDKLPRADKEMLTLVYEFDNPYDAYVCLCEAYSSGVHIVNVSCGTELPQ